jgi:hypothetical protein
VLVDAALSIQELLYLEVTCNHKGVWLLITSTCKSTFDKCFGTSGQERRESPGVVEVVPSRGVDDGGSAQGRAA